MTGSNPLLLDEAGETKNPQVLGHCRSTDRKTLGKFTHRSRAHSHELKYLAPSWISEGG